ncbi:hypothetical protein VOLCADRAFT_92054 [Volvox carteri f. nagariensis]|uniref:BACK domain-containing protein n=1 Tax=Volvox carteri f. nagariensis TaxID=3068 RepID=D8TYZ8_VOLCA|nr:uncharacterized protein VOLCADRAFT_92054 [Volvox carteri f. nagariensis]EFJ47307.1 hypothetical protein VOLCADRAFT_92054 [Volvox carteri f. nagariensis]|eukprot:XP_002951496.1 hypothetical protein VOLCADRAFT_92054 [Volvox carteri f. nagariensis]
MQIGNVPVNRHILRGLSELFNSQQDSDCVIIFCRERCSNPISEAASSSKRKGPDGEPSRQEVFGDPMPGHRFVLRCASEHFKAKLERWCEAQNGDAAPAPSKRLRVSSSRRTATAPSSSSAAAASAAATTPAPTTLSYPQLLIPLGSAAEVSSTRAAIQFAYTGQVAAGSVREALEVRRQGGYLQIHGCAAACDELIKRLIKEVASDDALLSTDITGAVVKQKRKPQAAGCWGSTQGLRSLGLQAAFELYEHENLWPEGASADASFASVLSCAGASLVSHFGSTLAVLNSPLLNERLLSLPAIALELLLCSDDLATDCESSVLLLLATWMRENFHKTNDEDRKRLCRTVRLAQLSRPYAGTILPALAADYELALGAEEKPSGWFPLNLADALFTSSVVNAQEDERLKLLAMALNQADKAPLASQWASMKLNRRPQCIPPTGLEVRWHVRQEELLAALARLQPGKTAKVCCTFEASGRGISDSDCSIYIAAGFSWSLWIKMFYGPQRPFAGLFVRCELPTAFAVPGSRLCLESATRMVEAGRADKVGLPGRDRTGQVSRCRIKIQVVRRTLYVKILL